MFSSALLWMGPLASAPAFAGPYINTAESCISEDSITPAEIQACTTIKTVNHCDDFIRTHPQFVDEERQCDRKTLAFERRFYAPEAIASCFGGIIPIKLIGSLINAARNNAHVREQFLTAADQDVVLKRLIVGGDPRYSRLSDAELASISADILFQQEQFIGQERANAAAIVRAGNSFYNAPHSSAGDSKNPAASSQSTFDYEHIFEMVQKMIQNKYQNFVCLDMQFQWRFSCESAVSLLGMSMPVAGGALKLLAASKVTEVANAAVTLDSIPEDIKELIVEGTEGAAIGADVALTSASVVTKLNAVSNPPFTVPDSGTSQVDELRARVSTTRKSLLKKTAIVREELILLKAQFDLSKGYLSKADQLRLWNELKQSPEYKDYLNTFFEYQSLSEVLSDFTKSVAQGHNPN